MIKGEVGEECLIQSWARSQYSVEAAKRSSQGPDFMGANPISATYDLCDLTHVA